MCFSPLFTPLVPFPEMPDPQAISYSFEILVLRVDLTARRGPRYILYSGNLDSTHQDLRTAHSSREFRAHALRENF